MTKKKIVISLSAIAVILVVVILMRSCKNKTPEIVFETSKVVKGNVKNEVTATGTIEALKTVDVGTQVSGVISKIYVDFNSAVKRGQVLAELDRTPLLASLEIAQSSLDDSKAELLYQTSNFDRIKALFDKNLVAKTDYDLALYNYSRAQATVKNSQSNYDKARINLSYATIYSPIDGVVLNRAVDEGQTVAASFSTPTLFSIAKDLTQMQVEANIDEADIGMVKNGQDVSFTVDAFPDLSFNGKVTQIRLEPVITSNVVTYTVIVEAQNPEKKLMPGMTANISVVVENAENVLLVPYKAIRFKPDNSIMASYMSTLSKDDMPEPPKVPQTAVSEQGSPTADGNTAATQATASDESKIEVWVKSDKLLRPVEIETGVSDGTKMEIKKGLKEGEEVVLTMTQTSGSTTSTGTASSPFMPKPPQDKKSSTK